MDESRTRGTREGGDSGIVTERADIDGGGGIDVTEWYVGPSELWIANRLPHRVRFEGGWFLTTTAICHGGETDGLAFRQRHDGNGIDVRCHTRGCSSGVALTGLETRIGLSTQGAYEPAARTAGRVSRLKRWFELGIALWGTAALMFATLLLLGLGLEAAVFGYLGVCAGAWLMIWSLGRLFAGRLRR